MRKLKKKNYIVFINDPTNPGVEESHTKEAKKMLLIYPYCKVLSFLQTRNFWPMKRVVKIDWTYLIITRNVTQTCVLKKGRFGPENEEAAKVGLSTLRYGHEKSKHLLWTEASWSRCLGPSFGAPFMFYY